MGEVRRVALSRGRKFFSELLRRKVVRLVGAYVAVLWLLAQGISSVAPPLGIPNLAVRLFLIAGIALIPVLAYFSWKYDLMPPQLVRDLDSANGKFLGHARVAGRVELPQTCDLRLHVNGPTVSVHIAKTPETLVS